jgi:hypothetical protein
MSHHLDTLTSYIGLINYIFNTTSFKNKNNFFDLNRSPLITNEIQNISDIITITTHLKTAFSQNNNQSISDDDLKTLSNFTKKMLRVNIQALDNHSFSELVYELYNDVIPVVDKMAKNANHFSDISFEINTLLQILVTKLLDNSEISKKLNEQLIFKLIAHLYDFDKARTYDYYLNSLVEIGDIFPDDRIKTALNIITSFLKNYTDITDGTGKNQGKKAIDFDVEGFLTAYQNITYDKWRPLEFLFDVGVNNVHFQRGLQIDTSTLISNYSFVGEKIGFRIKLRDWKYLRGFEKGETFTYMGNKYIRLKPSKKPVLSNIHALFYGSGILYNLVNTGTTEDFNRPLVSGGLGLTFYNSLNISLSGGKPLAIQKSDDSPWFFNIGFDINFSEYLTEVQKKRNNKKMTKAIEKIRAENKD